MGLVSIIRAQNEGEGEEKEKAGRTIILCTIQLDLNALALALCLPHLDAVFFKAYFFMMLPGIPLRSLVKLENTSTTMMVYT